MPLEGRNSWHSGAHLPLLLCPGRATINDDYGPYGAAKGWISLLPPPNSARRARVCCGPDGAAGGGGPERFRGKRTEQRAGYCFDGYSGGVFLSRHPFQVWGINVIGSLAQRQR